MNAIVRATVLVAFVIGAVIVPCAPLACGGAPAIECPCPVLEVSGRDVAAAAASVDDDGRACGRGSGQSFTCERLRPPAECDAEAAALEEELRSRSIDVTVRCAPCDC